MHPFRGIFLFAFAILVMTGTDFLSSAAYAQNRAQGEFQLSQTTHWEKAILPEGKYLYSVETDASPAMVHVWQEGGSFSGVFVPKSVLRENSTGRTEIVVERVGEGVYVSSLYVREINAALDFSTPDGDANSAGPDPTPEPATLSPVAGPSELFKVINPGHAILPIADAEKVYLNACRLIEEEFNRAVAVRPQLILHLGAEENMVRYPNNEIRLKKWDEVRFAEGVVEIALHDLVSSEERQRISDTAVNLANTTVSVCDLKTCRN